MPGAFPRGHSNGNDGGEFCSGLKAPDYAQAPHAGWSIIWPEMGYLFGQKRRKVGRLQRQAARCFLVTPEASSVELATWCWPRVVLIEKRPLTDREGSSMNRPSRRSAHD